MSDPHLSDLRGSVVSATAKILRYHAREDRVFDTANDTVIVSRALLSKAADELETFEGAAIRRPACSNCKTRLEWSDAPLFCGTCREMGAEDGSIRVDRRALEYVLLLHSHDMPMTADVVEPIRRALQGGAER